MAKIIAGATGIVLAGGASRRFGADKALASWKGGERLVERVCARLRPLFPELLVIVKHPARFGFLEGPGVAVRQDLLSETHSLGGVLSGLRHCATQRAFVCACDMPHLQSEVVRALWEASEGYDAAVAVWGGTIQSLCAVYSKNCIDALESMAGENRLAINALFARVRARFVDESELRKVDPGGLSFFDVDTPERLARAKEFA
ncbi:MAG: molybdenum cofactor guanylyltransferase [Elusimicrobia bacterium]|nr:molybdenum cofactor guanylyltransferase [Elusimicrobiota bacterium]